MKTFKDKVAIVTGGAKGIGQSLVAALAERGAHIAYCDIADMSTTAERVKAMATGVRTFTARVNMAEKKEIKAFTDSVLEEFGHVDILINNAGIALGDRTFEEVTTEDFERITDINYWGVIYTTQLLYPHLLKRPEAAIANLSSSQGILPLPYLIPYSTTKFAVRGFTDALRSEHKTRGIKNLTVHTVHPGAVATDITLRADYHGANTEVFHKIVNSGVSPDKAAGIILKGIQKNTGRIFISDGRAQDLLVRLLPEGSAAAVRWLLKSKGAVVR